MPDARWLWANRLIPDVGNKSPRLVERGLLGRLERHDREPITAALHQFFNRSVAVLTGHA
jgi:hypothetical protein